MKKEQQIYEDINQLFHAIIRKKGSGDIKAFFRFLKKNPHHAPFNNALVFAQRPECVYYMTADQWKERLGRTIRPDAVPMVILFPFGPVRFVYDFKDTEGETGADENSSILWWEEDRSNMLSVEIFDRTIHHIKTKYQLPLVHKGAREYLEDNSLSTGGYAAKYFSDDRFEISLHPKYREVTNSNIDEAYGVLVHEIGHILLGHLGTKKYFVGRGDKMEPKDLCPDRSHIRRSVAELEAELTAWLVFSRFGIEKKSVDYMATWLSDDKEWQQVDISRALRIANTIFEMRG